MVTSNRSLGDCEGYVLLIEIPCDFVYGYDCVLRWRGLEQNKEVMLPLPIKGWTRSCVGLVEPKSKEEDRWLVVSTDLRSKSEGEGHWEALRFTQDEWGTDARTHWYGETHPTCIFTDKQNRVKMMYTRFRKTKRGAKGFQLEREAIHHLTVKRYAAAVRVVDNHLQFWLPIPPYNGRLSRDISKCFGAVVPREDHEYTAEGKKAERMARRWGVSQEPS